MQKTFQNSLLILLTLVCLTAVDRNSLMGQTGPKGWMVEYQQDWIHAPFGYQLFKIKIGTNPAAPLQDTVEFQVVVKQQQNGRDHSVTVTPIVVKEGDTFAEVDVLVNKTHDTYNNYINVHVERDGNLNFDQGRDLFSFYTYVGSIGAQSSGMPTILFISSAVTNNVTKQIRTKRSLIPVAGPNVFTIDDAKFPSVQALYEYYPDANGQLIGMSGAAKKNPTALDVMESPWIHAIELNNVPHNWLALTAAEIVVVSYEDLAKVAKDPAKMESIRKWVAAGGTLVVNNSGAAYEKAPRVRAMVDGQNSLSARRKHPWIVPGKKIKQVEHFIVHEHDSNNFYYGGPQPKDNFKNKDKMRKVVRRDWKPINESDDLATAIDDAECKFALYKYVLGRVVVVGDNMFAWKAEDWKHLLNASMMEDRTISERFGTTTATVPADNFAIQGVGKPPVREFQFLIGFFVLAIGPISYFVLKRQSRLQLLFITVPAISLIACVGLLSYALLSDGFQNRGRMRSFTAIDHSRQRAISFIRHSHYAGVQPDDYLFENDEAVFNGRSWSSPRSVVMQNPGGISLNGGDIRPRMPHQIVSVRNYDTDQRLALIPADSPTEPPAVQNQFDDPIRFAVLRTETGYFYVENLAPGDTVATQKIQLGAKALNLRQSEARDKLIDLLETISPKVKDDFFNRSAYNTDPFYGYYRPNSDEPASVECDFQLRALRGNIDQIFKEPGQYVAILEEFSDIPAPQPNIDYKNKLHIIHGKW